MFFSRKQAKKKLQEGLKHDRGGGGGIVKNNNSGGGNDQSFGGGLWENNGGMKRSSSKGILDKGSTAVMEHEDVDADAAGIEWEMRPGGMLVQRRDVTDAAAVFGPLVKIKVSFGLVSHDITAPAHGSFGDVKRLLVPLTGLAPKEQRLLFKGVEKEDSEALHMAGVKDKAKLILVEDPAARERKVQEQYKQEKITRSYQIVTSIQAEVDKLAEQVSTSEGSFRSGDALSASELRRLNEALMQRLLRLDGIEAVGEVKILRRTQLWGPHNCQFASKLPLHPVEAYGRALSQET